MPVEPEVKRVIAFVDGQNLFHAAKKAFGSRFPDYNPKALAERICADRGWTLSQTFFYTGIPDRADNAVWNHFWTARMAVPRARLFTASAGSHAVAAAESPPIQCGSTVHCETWRRPEPVPTASGGRHFPYSATAIGKPEPRSVIF